MSHDHDDRIGVPVQPDPTTAVDHVTHYLARHDRAVTERLLLLTRELLDYAHRNRRGDLSLSVRLTTGDVARVTLHDDAPVAHAQALRPRSDDPSIQLLTQLGASWGVGPGRGGRGTGIWAEARVPPRPRDP